MQYGVRSPQQVEYLYSQAMTNEEKGSPFWGMTYEEGIKALINWMQGDDSEHPFGGKDAQ